MASRPWIPQSTGRITSCGAARGSSPSAGFTSPDRPNVAGSMRRRSGRPRPFHPRSPYGVSKVAGFYLALNYREAMTSPVVMGFCSTTRARGAASNLSRGKITDGVARIKLGLASELLLGNWKPSEMGPTHGTSSCAMHLMLQQPEADDYVVCYG